jgi:hypothetical protein
MRLWYRPRRWVLLPATACAVIALAGLVIAGSRDLAVRTASADSPNQLTIATLRPGHAVCEGPLTSQGPARGAGIWGGATGSTATLTVTVRDAFTRKAIASGSLQAGAQEGEWTVRLDRHVPGGQPVQICLTEDVGAFSLVGSAVSVPGVTVTGIPTGQRYSLVLLSDQNRSLLGSLSLAFSRASLWRPSWVGAWTFWVLALALLMTFGLAVAAVVRAADDDLPPPPTGLDGAVPEPVAPLPDERSERGEDRPQAVS